MQKKYVFGTFTAFGRPARDGRFNRRITLSDFDDRFAIVNRNISDDTLRKREVITGIWSIDKICKDKRGNDFLVCSPVRALTREENDIIYWWNSCGMGIIHALTKMLPEDLDVSYSDRMNGNEKEILQRMLYYAGITGNIHTGQKKLLAQFAKGKFDFGTLYKYATTPVCSQPQTAKLTVPPLYFVQIGPQKGIDFVDANNFDTQGNVVHIEADNFADWENNIPEYLDIHVDKNLLYLNIDTSMFDISMARGTYCNNVKEYLYDKHYFIATPKNGGKPMRMFIRANDVDRETFNAFMSKMGLTLKDNAVVPADMPDWDIDNMFYAKEVFTPDHYALAQFENGMAGYYPLLYLVQKYPGKCKNAYFTVSDTTADSWTIEARLSRVFMQ